MTLRKRIGCIVALLLLLAGNQALYAQLSIFTNEDGLPNRFVRQTLEDHEGFLWVATDNGLARFDGNEFSILKDVGKDSANLTSPHISSLAKTPGGQLVIGTSKGLAILSADRNSLWYPIPDSSPAAGQPITSIAVFDNGHIAFTTQEEQLYMLFEEQQLKHVNLGGKANKLCSIDSNRVLVLNCSDRSGTFWIINSSGEIIQKSRTAFPYVDGVIGPEKRVYFTFDHVVKSTTWEFWVEAYSLVGERVKRWKLEGDLPIIGGSTLSDIIFYSGGYLWLNPTGEVIVRLDPSEGDFSFFTGNEIGKSPSIAVTNFTHVLEDRNENLWFSSNGGLIGFNQKQKAFKVLKPDRIPKDDIFSTRIIYPWGDKHFLISLYNSSFLLNRETHEFTRYDHIPGNHSTISVRSILSFGADSLLVGTELLSLYWLKGGKKVLENALLDSEPIKPISTMVCDLQGRVWVGGQTGFYRYDAKIKKLHSVSGFENNNESTRRIYELQYDPEMNLIWMASDRGLIKFEVETGQYQVYDLLLPNSPLANIISTCLVLQKEVLWIGTRESGLIKFDRATEKITHFTAQNGLSDNLVYSALEDAKGRLWLGTANGLSVFDPATEKFTTFYRKDGIAHNEFNTGSTYRSANGELYMGGLNGITLFDPEEVLADKKIPGLRLCKIIRHDGASNREIETTHAIGESKKLTIYPNDRYFSVSFSSEDLLNQSNTFEYRLDGLENDWNFLGTQKSIRFAGLSTGNYTLFVRETGSADDQTASLILPIEVLAPWYKRWWAILISILLGLALLLLFYSFRIKQLRTTNQLKLEQLKVEKKEELDKMKSDFFANISHEFRTPLTLILGPLENNMSNKNGGIGEKQQNMMRRNARQLLSLINQLLDLSKLDNGSMKFQPVVKDLAAHLRLIISNFEGLITLRNIGLQPAIPGRELLVSYDVDHMEKIMNNLLSNALKFCEPGGRIEVTCRKNYNETVQIVVANTGKIPPHILPELFTRFYQQDKNSGQGTGIGLALTRELVEYHNGTITAKSEKGITSFVVELPLNLNEKNVEELHTGSFTSPTLSPIPYVGTALPGEPDDRSVKKDAPLILVVDDNADLREFLTDILRTDYQVIQAANGVEGLNLASDSIPDLVISDLMMPEMDGHELCHRLKTAEPTSHIPVILLTAKANQDSKLKGLEKGADDYLMKPFNGPELLIRVKNLIRLRRLLQEKYSGKKLVKLNQKSSLDLEDAFMQKVVKVIDEHIHQEDFSVDVFCQKLFLSPRQVQRKLKALTNQTPVSFIRQYRLQKAYEKIQKGEITISEAAASVGMSNLSHFSKAFKREFGVAPSEV